MRVLAELTLPFVRVGGCVIAQKSVDSKLEEISAATKSVRECGGRLERIIPAWPPDWKELLGGGEKELDKNLDAKHMIQVRKEKPTPSKYPRGPGSPKKFPL
ncbi:16S rRNA methyltransferase [Gracilaria domingensis]|nr:16S rRNA methyltransferase [Gracilaria domingensis]